jgi:hypothetical protein
MVRLYSNENFPLPVVEELRRLGHDTLTSREAGNAGFSIPDDRVLAFAITEQRAVLTLNRLHFIRLHRAMPEHTGIIVCTFDSDFTGQARRLDQLLRQSGRLAGRLLRVNRPNPSWR